MKKIMFNDKFLLTQAVLDGWKTMTRRVLKDNAPLGDWEETAKHFQYKIGEVVAIAQRYKDVFPDADFEMADECTFLTESRGWNNKLFVRAEKMPHHIEITDVRVERLQEISDEDCIREGAEFFLREICRKGAERYEKNASELYWISGGDYDQSIPYCEKCAEKEVKNLNRNIDEDSDEYSVCGGCSEGEEHPVYCDKCGKNLLFSFCGDIENELDNLELDNDGDLFLLNQVLSCEEDAEIVIRHFARQSFASLIDKVNGEGTWEQNPWVVVYGFELAD